MRTIEREGVKIKVIRTEDEARKLLDHISRTWKSIPALDFETTALTPDEHEKARVRITSIGVSDKLAYVIDHDFCGDFASYADDLIALTAFYVFNVNFEGKWFANSVSSVTALSRRLLDVAHMRHAVQGGGPLKLATQAKMDLKVELDKSEQNSNWGKRMLSEDQYFYAGFDTIVTKRLGDMWSDKMEDNHWRGFWVINEVWRAANECMDTGLFLDVPYHSKLIRMWTRRREAAEKAFRKYVPVEHVQNMRSKIQMSNFLKQILDEDTIDSWPATAKTKQLSTERKQLRAMSYISPYPLSRALAAYMVYTRADKYLSTYGDTLQTIQSLSATGRLHSRINIAQAITGRTSSSKPNQQNFPNAWYFRYAFMEEQGFKMVLADYSSIEVRVLAELSGDKILLHDVLYGDVHTQSAIAIFKIKDEGAFVKAIKDKDPRAKAMRTKAKAFTFQLLYGAGAAALAIALRCSVAEAEEAIKSWAGRYTKAYKYRQTMFEAMNHSGFLPCASGRTIFVMRQDRSMPVAANYPIQGSAGDVMYAAMRHTQLILEEREIDALLMASVHDEVLLRSDEYCAEEARQALEDGMRAGWLEIFPDTNTDNLVDAVVGQRWSDKS